LKEGVTGQMKKRSREKMGDKGDKEAKGLDEMRDGKR